MSSQLRGLLHRAEHFIRDPGDAGWQTGWRSLRAAERGESLSVVWLEFAAAGLSGLSGDG